jgi:hypothetical protein
VTPGRMPRIRSAGGRAGAGVGGYSGCGGQPAHSSDERPDRNAVRECREYAGPSFRSRPAAGRCSACGRDGSACRSRNRPAARRRATAHAAMTSLLIVDAAQAGRASSRYRPPPRNSTAVLSGSRPRGRISQKRRIRFERPPAPACVPHEAHASDRMAACPRSRSFCGTPWASAQKSPAPLSGSLPSGATGASIPLVRASALPVRSRSPDAPARAGRWSIWPSRRKECSWSPRRWHRRSRRYGPRTGPGPSPSSPYSASGSPRSSSPSRSTPDPAAVPQPTSTPATQRGGPSTMLPYRSETSG